MFELLTVAHYSAAYHGIRERVRALIGSASDAQLESMCPTTPAWRVRDTLAHLGGVPCDILAGRMENVASDEWTQAQVDMRTEWSIAKILDAWDDEGEQLVPIMEMFPIVSLGQMVFDAYTHELDIAHALGVVTDHSVDVAQYSFQWAVTVAGPGTTQPLHLCTPNGEVAFGPATDTSPTLTIDAFDFARAATGRRSANQIAAYESSAAIDPHKLLLAPFFSVSAVDIVE